MEKQIKIQYDKEGDYLEVLFDTKPGFFKETDDDSVMEKLTMKGTYRDFLF